jgi:hypothetical protein
MTQISPRSNGSDHITISHFTSWKVRALPSFDFPVSEMLISHHVSSGSNGPRDFVFRDICGLLDAVLSIRDYVKLAHLFPRILFDDGWSPCFWDFVSPLHLALNGRAHSSGSNDGQSSCSDLTPEICSPSLRAPPVWTLI